MGQLSFMLELENVRTFRKASICIPGMRVLIGDNGSGKSSVLEALEILRRATQPNFLQDVQVIHGGYLSLAREPAQDFTFTMTVRDDEVEADWLNYSLTLRQAPSGLGTQLVREIATVRRPGQKEPRKLLQQDIRGARFLRSEKAGDMEELKLATPSTVLSFVGQGQLEGAPPSLRRLAQQLAAIQVHPGWEVLPTWLSRAYQRKSATRSAQILVPAPDVKPLGENLVSVLHNLKNSTAATWQAYLETVRKGLELPVENVNIRVGAEGGTGAIALKLSSLQNELPATTLSDGQLAWLGWSAILNAERPSLLALDEPDLHLHPALSGRLMLELKEYARTTPVLLSTHSDTLLDALDEPAEQTLLLALDADMSTRLGQLEPTALAQWLKEYRGVGELRRQGMLGMLTQDVPEAKE